MIIQQDAITFLIGSISFFFIYGIVFMMNISNNIKRKTELEEFKTITNTINETLLLSNLDSLIATIFDKYILLQVETNTSFKIMNDTEIIMTKEVAGLVMEAVSPVLLKNLSMVYNSDKITRLITDRVYMQVFAYLLSKKK